MTTTLMLPTSADLRKVEQDLLPTLTQDDPLFGILPIELTDSDVIAFEQEDDFSSLQNVRGLNGMPGNVTKTGFNRFEIKPGYYGEHMTVDETELTKRRKIGTLGVPVDVRDLTARCQAHLLQRRINRIRQIGWNLLTRGTFSVSNSAGNVVHTDTFPLQTQNVYDFPTASIDGGSRGNIPDGDTIYGGPNPWTDRSYSGPLRDITRTCLKYRGYSTRFNETDKFYANSRTVNAMLGNWNQYDLFGRLWLGSGHDYSVRGINKLLTDRGLPNVVPYDGFYVDSNPTGAFQTKTHIDPTTGNTVVDGYTHYLIPDNICVFVGHRLDKSPIGAYRITRHASNANAKPGFFVKVTDNVDKGPPRKIQVWDAHNGAPVITWPSSIIILYVGPKPV